MKKLIVGLALAGSLVAVSATAFAQSAPQGYQQNQNEQFGRVQSDPQTIRVRMDGRDIELQPGQHTIRVSGRDQNGRPFDQTWQFTTAAPIVSNFINDLQPAEDSRVPNSMVVSGRTNPNSRIVVQLNPFGDQRQTVNGAIGSMLGINERANAVRVETNADGNGYFSVQIDIDARSGQQLGLVVDSTQPRTQQTAHMTRTLVIR